MGLHWAYSGDIVYYLTPGSPQSWPIRLKFAVCGLAFRVLSLWPGSFQVSPDVNSGFRAPIVPCQTSIEIIHG